MVSDKEAALEVVNNLKKKGYEVTNIDAIEADIHAIRERKLKGEKAVKAIKAWEQWKKKID